MADIFDMQIFQITGDIDLAWNMKASRARPPKPRTSELLSYASHAKCIVYFKSHGNTWNITTACAMAEALKNIRIAIHQLSSYRTRVVAFDKDCTFIDMYFPNQFINSDIWEMKMKSLLIETLENGGSMSKNLQKRFYPDIQIASDRPKIDWKALEDQPFLTD